VLLLAAAAAVLSAQVQDSSALGIQATCLLPPAAHSKVAMALSDGPETLWQALRRYGVNVRPAVVVVNGQRLSQLPGQRAAAVMVKVTGEVLDGQQRPSSILQHNSRHACQWHLIIRHFTNQANSNNAKVLVC
jgi:hypothetical protein